MDIETSDSGFSLTTALLIYDRNGESVVTRHPVRDGAIEPGEPVDIEAYLRSLSPTTANAAAFHWIGERELARASTWVAWWRPSGVTTVFVKGKARRAFIPSTVMVAGEHLRVWAFDGDTRPTQRTPLYLVPWSNTYKNGGICWGSGRTPATLSPAEWEDAFFASSFDSPDNLNLTKYVPSKTLERFGTLGESLGALHR